MSNKITQIQVGSDIYDIEPNVSSTLQVDNAAPTLAWNTTSTVGTVDGVNLTVKMPANPVPGSLKNPNALTIKANSDSTGLIVYDGSVAKTFVIKPAATAGAFIVSDGTTEKTIQLAGKFTDTTANQTITLSGDATGSGTTSIAVTIPSATQSAKGLMSKEDKANLDGLVAIWKADGTDDTLINKIQEVLTAFENAPEGTNIVTALAGKVDKTTTVNGHALSGNVTVSKSDIGLGSVGNFKAVSTVASQGLTDTEKSNARANIGAGTSSFSGSYNDLTNKPTIPTVNNATLTIQKNGTTVATFTANSSENKTANITVPTGAAANKEVDTSISAASTSTNLPTSKAVAAFVEGKGYKTTDNNTSHSHSAGVGLVGSGDAGTSGGTYNYKAALVNETKSSNASAYAAGGASKFYAVQLDKNGKLAVNVPWTDTNTQDGNDNQKVKTGSVTFGVNDIVEFVAGDNVTITGNATNKTIEISATDTNTHAVTSVAGKTGDVTLTKSDVGLGSVGNFKAVSTVASQGLTDTEKSNARANIGAGTSNLTIGTTSTTAAAGNHTHTTTIASSTGTNELTLAHGSKYAITAGGDSFVFTMPAAQTSVSGNAGTATKLASAKTISLAGDVTGSVSFDGSNNVSMTTTISDDSHNHTIANVDGLQDALNGKQASGSYVTTTNTGVQSIAGGLVVGGASATATGKGRIMVTGNTNPLIGLQAVDSNGNQLTPYYFQITNDIMYLGPTSTKALAFDSNGNTTIPAALIVAGAISEGGTALSGKYALKTELPTFSYNSTNKTLTIS